MATDLPSLPGCLSDTLMSIMSAASCLVGLRSDASEIGGCLFTQVLEPLLQRRMFSVVDIVHFTCPNVNVTRVQQRPTDVSSAKCRIGTELENCLGCYVRPPTSARVGVLD